MAKKKFKTISGYLRSRDDEMRQAVYRIPEDQFEEAAANAARKVINHLLPQLGLAVIDDDIHPTVGIMLMLDAGSTEQQIKALKDCQKWLAKPITIWTVTTGASTQCLNREENT